jgi:hypothetical protein
LVSIRPVGGTSSNQVGAIIFSSETSPSGLGGLIDFMPAKNRFEFQFNSVTNNNPDIRLDVNSTSGNPEITFTADLNAVSSSVVLTTAALNVNAQDAAGFSLYVASGINAAAGCITLQGGQVCGPSSANLSGSGTSGTIPKFTGSGTLGNTTTPITENVNGIGISTPSAQATLDVNGNSIVGGHEEFYNSGNASSTTISACGTAPNFVGGNDNVGSVVSGSASVSCTLNFGTRWTNVPVCVFWTTNTGTMLSYGPTSTTQVTVNVTSATGFSYHCRGYR